MRKQLISLLAAVTLASASLDAPPAAWAAGQAPSSIRDAEGETTIRAYATPLFLPAGLGAAKLREPYSSPSPFPGRSVMLGRSDQR
jgi:hypothetical protein